MRLPTETVFAQDGRASGSVTSLIQIEDTRGKRLFVDRSQARATSSETDARGSTIRNVASDESFSLMRYDDQGRRIRHVSFEGVVMQSVFDDTPAGRGRLVEKRYFPIGNGAVGLVFGGKNVGGWGQAT